ncbi:hypothetical protein BT67DRAFT_135489 [Trichocladium antarcticum]|uniref:Uncharacterized protein n=1 Tax=Trichocladium antarcticum TaxID=1450529 RepID=A0AAN6ZBK6_9PEZI|nr:hypothetical protein BT67DRAFT_135489 [Trichocladium antarcticum]
MQCNVHTYILYTTWARRYVPWHGQQHARTLASMDSHPGCCAMYMYVPGTQNMRNTCGCKRNGVLLGWEGGCNASIPSLSANLSRPRSLAPHSTADPPQLSTLCQMLASLKNVLARPDARKSAALNGPPQSPSLPIARFSILHLPTPHTTRSPACRCTPRTILFSAKNGRAVCRPLLSLNAPLNLCIRPGVVPTR